MIVMAITLFLVVFLAAFAVLSSILTHLGDSKGSWHRLAAAFPGIEHEPGHPLDKQTIQVGVVTYKACARVGIEPEGLWVGRSGLLPFMPAPPSIFIPWRQIRSVSPGTLYWAKAQVLHVGQPEVGTLLVPEGLFSKMAHRLADHSFVAGTLG
jgi:hypothetical protein